MITLIIGLPNAGKTTYSEKYENVIHLDEMRKQDRKHAHENILKAVKEAKEDIVIEGVYNGRLGREQIVQAAGDAKKVCIWIDTPIETCLERNTRGILIIDSLEPPEYSEGWDEIRIVRNDKETKKKRGKKNDKQG